MRSCQLSVIYLPLVVTEPAACNMICTTLPPEGGTYCAITKRDGTALPAGNCTGQLVEDSPRRRSRQPCFKQPLPTSIPLLVKTTECTLHIAKCIISPVTAQPGELSQGCYPQSRPIQHWPHSSSPSIAPANNQSIAGNPGCKFRQPK